MKTNPLQTFACAASAAFLLAAATQAHGADGSWNVNAAGNWGTSGNWTPAAVPGTGPGDVVNLLFNITAARTVTIDTTSRTVGDLNIGDSATTLFGYTLAASGGAVLNLDGTGTTDATVDFTANVANTISAPLTLVDNAVFRSNVATAQVISGVISGAGKAVTFNNDTNGTANPAVALQGQFNVSGVNTYTGGTSISDVRVQASNASALGTGPVTIAAGGQVFANSAITIANNFTISGNGWTETTAGQPLGALRLEGNAIISGTVAMAADSGIGGNGTGTINGVISGTGFNLTKRGTGTLILTNANTYSGGTTIGNGAVQLNNNSAAGSGPISLVAGGATSATRLLINGGVTAVNDINIGPVFGVAGQGVLQQTGTGLATLNGAINITGGPSAGGHFVGGNATGNALVLNGAITSTVGVTQRDGFVRYGGGGTGYTSLTVTNNAQVAAANGIATTAVVVLGGSGNATLDLNGFNQELAGLTRNGSTTTVTTASGSPTLTLNVAGSNSFTYNGGITGAVALSKTGSGTQRISGTNSFTGGTTASQGLLIGTTPSALGTNSALTVSGTGNFSYQPTAAGALNLGGGSITLGSGATIGAALGGTASQSAITSSSAATVSGPVTVDVWMIPGVAPAAGANDLITAASGLDAGTYTLGKVYNVTDYTVSGLAATATAVSINVNAATPLTVAFWKGGLTGAANVWSASDGSTQSNWVASLGGANQPLVPGAGTDVTISNSTVATSPAPSVLGSNMGIKSLTIADTVNGLALNADTFSLTIGSGGITVASGVPASSVAAPVVLGAVQTWTNDSANALTVSGVVSGANALTKAGTGTLILSGANTNSGGVNLNAGTLVLGSTTALGAVGGNLVISGGTTLDTNVAGTLTMGNAKPTTIDGNFTYAGTTGSLNLGTGAVNLGTSGGTARSITVAANTLTLGGIISNGTTATGLTKLGTGTLALAGANTYSGQTTISAGTLNFSTSAGLGDASLTNTIDLSGGAQLVQTGAAAVDLGANRAISIGTGGGTISHSNGTAATLTLSGNLSGNAPLTFRTLLGGNGTYTLSGSNSGYTGAISVEAASTGLSTLSIANAAAVPGASSITLNYPAAATGNGNATTLNVATGITLPATTTLNFTSSLPTASLSLRSGMGLTGPVVVDSPITLAGDSIIQFSGTGSTTYGGNVTETTPGAYVQSGLSAYSNTLFYRGTGSHTVNGTINLPSAGAQVSVTDGATLILNSTGNAFSSAAAVFGTFRIGATNAVPTTARLLIGQAGNQACTFDLNGFDQTVSGLEWAAPTGNLLTKGISNSSATTTSTFTVNQATAPITATFNGTISGRVNFVKEGAATVTLGAAASNFTGNVAVNAGTLVASSAGANDGSATTLGQANLAGRTVTVNNTGTLNFTSNNIFGNGVGNANLPKLIINSGGTVSATRYNVVGDLELNGGTLTQASTDTVGFEGYQFRGGVTAGGSAASTIATTNGAANHLAATTVFTIADATGSPAADLVVSSPLRDPSGDFPGETSGGLTKTGPGTLQLTGISTYSGATIVNGGTLEISSTGNVPNAGGATVNTGGTLTVNGTLGGTTTVNAGGLLNGSGTTGAVAISGGVISPGNSPGILNTGNLTTTGAAFTYEINGANPGTGYDQIQAGGAVDIGFTSVFNFTATYTPNPATDRFWLIVNDGADPILGEFAGIPEGTPVTVNGQPYYYTYQANSTTSESFGGNDFALIPEPSTALLALLGAAGLLRRRRRLD